MLVRGGDVCNTGASMKLRGEYWITDGECLLFAGDGGDFNHEGHAEEHVRRLLLDALRIDYGNHDCICATVMADSIEEFLKEDRGMSQEDIDAICFSDHLKAMAEELNIERHLIDAAYGYFHAPIKSEPSCVREYVMKHFGWLWVKQTFIGTWEWNRDQFDLVCAGLDRIYDEEDDHFQEPDKTTIEVRVHSTSCNYDVTLADLYNKNYNTCGVSIALNNQMEATCSDQVRRVEAVAAEPYYNGRRGD